MRIFRGGEFFSFNSRMLSSPRMGLRGTVCNSLYKKICLSWLLCCQVTFFQQELVYLHSRDHIPKSTAATKGTGATSPRLCACEDNRAPKSATRIASLNFCLSHMKLTGFAFNKQLCLGAYNFSKPPGGRSLSILTSSLNIVVSLPMLVGPNRSEIRRLNGVWVAVIKGPYCLGG